MSAWSRADGERALADARRARAPRRRPAVDDDRLVLLWQQGRPAAEIAVLLGVTANAVHQRVRRLRNAGVDLPARRERSA